MKKSYIFVAVLLIELVALFLSNSLFSYFSQDDFFHLRSIMDKSLSSIPSFFISEQKEYAFYRPLSRETFNLLMYHLFGLNSLVFHLINFTLIILNGILILKFAKSLTNHTGATFIALILYLFSAVHNIELYYLASFQTLISTTFVLSGLIFYLSYLKKGLKKFWFFSILSFLFAILSHESSAVFAALIVLLELLVWRLKKKKAWVILANIAPFFAILGFRLLIHSFGSRLDAQISYQPAFAIKDIVNTLAWYTLWSFGMPEMLTDFTTLTLNFNPNLFKYYSYYTNIVFPLFLLVVLSLILIVVSLPKSNWKDKNIWFFAAGYIISLLPFLFFPNHKFVYYLTLPILFFSAFCGSLLGKYWHLGSSHKFLIITFLTAYIVISFQTINLNEITHWAAKRANSANFLIKDIKNKFRVVPKGGVFYIKNNLNYPFISKEWGTSSKQASYILSGSDAFKLIFNDSNIKVYYEDVTGPPPGSDKFIVYEPHFPY